MHVAAAELTRAPDGRGPCACPPGCCLTLLWVIRGLQEPRAHSVRYKMSTLLIRLLPRCSRICQQQRLTIGNSYTAEAYLQLVSYNTVLRRDRLIFSRLSASHVRPAGGQVNPAPPPNLQANAYTASAARAMQRSEQLQGGFGDAGNTMNVNAAPREPAAGPDNQAAGAEARFAYASGYGLYFSRE